ncbi:hypothetical protein WDU94_002053 [Cyamophila willieti]
MIPVFKRGVLYKGIYCPSLTNSFRESSLEMSYQRYSHRQRQKSLIIVNLVDMALKAVLTAAWVSYNKVEISEIDSTQLTWTIYTMLSNLAMCLLGWWRCFANNYLQWAAVSTWILLNLQGFVSHGIGLNNKEYLIWYILFIVFVTYAMLPLPLRWCFIGGCTTSILHVIITVRIKMNKGPKEKEEKDKEEEEEKEKDKEEEEEEQEEVQEEEEEEEEEDEEKEEEENDKEEVEEEE